MEISKKTLHGWRSKFKHGDATKIHKLSKKRGDKVSRQAISRALNGSSVDESTINAINFYYSIPKVTA